MDGRRKVHRKVKTGCTACKTRRQKCGEQKPRCTSCIRYSTDCIYLVQTAGKRQQPPSSQRVQSRERVQDALSVASDSCWQPSSMPSIFMPMGSSPPPPPPSSDLNFDDLELLHQYMTSTSVATAQLAAATAHIQMAVPPLAQTHHFVMHGILAQAAVHLSWLRPHRKEHYSLLAARHQSAALPQFRSALQSIDQDNHVALIMYSKGLVWCSFAWYEPYPGQLRTSHCIAVEASWLPHWFHLLRGSCLIADSPASRIESAWHIVPPPIGGDLDEFSDSPDNHRLIALRSKLLPLVDEDQDSSSSPIVGRDADMLSGLQEAFARASMRHHNTPLRNAMNAWVGGLSNEHIHLLEKGHPLAMVIMAHFCILVFRSETRWFMRGHAAKFLGMIMERLPDGKEKGGHDWKQYLQWPCEEIGLLLPSSSTPLAL